MKKLLALFVLGLNAVAAFAGKNDVTIKGVITNRLADSVTFRYATYGDNWLDYKSNTIHEKLSTDGSFTATLPLSNNYTNIRINNGGEGTEIYADPGDKITMTVDAIEFDASLKYEGAVADFMANHMRAYGFSSNFSEAVQGYMALEIPAFNDSLNKLVQQQLDFLIENNKGLPPSFVKMWNADYEYKKYNAKLEYPIMHEVIKKQSYNVGKIPAANYDVIKDVPAKFNDELLAVREYRDYLSSYYSVKVSAAAAVSGKTNTDDDAQASKLDLANRNMPRGSKEFVFADNIKSKIKYQSIAKTEGQYAKFSSQFGKNNYSKTLEGAIAKKKRLSTGATAVDFIAVDANGKDVKLSDLKGKVVYLDFWASWCGPCKAEFPHTKKIKEHFAGKDVAFVYVSIDEDAASWEKAMKKYELSGLHTRVDGWKGKLAQEYDINSVPSYFLIGKDGKFASDSTPRPSSGEELIKAIEALL